MPNSRKMMAKNHPHTWHIGMIIALFGHLSQANAQISQGGQPYSFSSTISAKEVKVTSTGWPDYVFAPDYNLMPLTEVAAYIASNGHLPEVPSADDVAANGLSLGESQALLLKKIEELTLYMIAMQQENEALKERVISIEGMAGQQ